ncbi:MAG: hypothetical protein JWM74_697, partial [Myxococcaceae bacterium]|nr:hypothetical protein [Myxococcaceae bacterium]
MIVTACSSSTLDVGSHPDALTNPSTTAKGTLFGSEVTLRSTYAADGSLLEVIVRLPMSAVDAAKPSPGLEPLLTLAMPSRISEDTFFEHMDVFWKNDGDGPTYDSAHFDFHFYRMTTGEVGAIDCLDPRPVPLELLPAGYSTTGIQTCLLQSGIHVSPDSDYIGIPFT